MYIHAQQEEDHHPSKAASLSRARPGPADPLAAFYAAHDGKVSDKWQSYLEVYSEVFSGYRDKPVRILEIGVQNGGSLEIWRQFFPWAEMVIGCDINPNCADLTYDDPAIQVVIGNANASETVEKITSLCDSFDIIIDDGSHLSSDIVKSFALYFPGLSQGGIYVVEDLHCSYWIDFEGGLQAPYSSLSFFKRLSDMTNIEHWGADLPPDQLLGYFTETYGITFDRSALAQIDAVSFYNSICIVRKTRSSRNTIGTRVVAGQVAMAAEEILAEVGAACPGMDEGANPWGPSAPLAEKLTAEAAELRRENARVLTGLDRAEAELERLGTALGEAETELKRLRPVLRQAILDRETAEALYSAQKARTKAMVASPSWRLTRPLRSIARLFSNGAGVHRSIPRQRARSAIPPQIRTSARSGAFHRPLIVFATHDCSRSGAPMVVLNMMREVLRDGAVDAIAVAKAPGHLIEDFAALAPLELLGHGKASRPAAHDLEVLLASLDRRPAAAFCNSILTADLVPVFRRHGVPVLSLVHEMPTTIRFFGEETIRTIDQNANAVVFGSEFVRDRTVAEFSCQNPNLRVVPTGYPSLERDRASVTAARERLRREADLPKDAIVVLGCGIIEHRKGVDLFVQIAKKLRDLPADALVRLVWIGQEMRDLYATWLRHDVAALGLTDMVRFLGPCADIDQYVPGADIFVLPSREDPLPLVTLAAFASGVPVVAFSGAGGAPEAIGNEAGIVVPYLDVGSMARAIATLAADATFRALLGAAARRRFETQYSMRVFLKRLFTVLQMDAGITLAVDVADAPTVPSGASCV